MGLSARTSSVEQMRLMSEKVSETKSAAKQNPASSRTERSDTNEGEDHGAARAFIENGKVGKAAKQVAHNIGRPAANTLKPAEAESTRRGHAEDIQTKRCKTRSGNAVAYRATRLSVACRSWSTA